MGMFGLYKAPLRLLVTSRRRSCYLSWRHGEAVLPTKPGDLTSNKDTGRNWACEGCVDIQRPGSTGGGNSESLLPRPCWRSRILSRLSLVGDKLVKL